MSETKTVETPITLTLKLDEKRHPYVEIDPPLGGISRLEGIDSKIIIKTVTEVPNA